MQKHERVVVELALQTLSSTMFAWPTDDAPVRLALRVLMPHCRDRSELSEYWNAKSLEKEGLRDAELTRHFNGIVNELEKSGAWKRRPGRHF